MHRRSLLLITGALLLAQGCSDDPTTPDVCVTSSWLSSSAYQTTFDAQVALNCYPVEVRGREGVSELEFQGVFEPQPPDPFAWVSRNGMQKAAFDQLDAELRGEGFQQVWLQRFTPADAIERFQATWTKP